MDSEYVRLKELEKPVSKYDLLKVPLQLGFDYGVNAVIKAGADRKDMEIVPMEWGFIPSYVKTRENLQKMRFGYKDEKGKFHPPITTLNAVSEELLFPGKIYREAALRRRCLVISSGFFEWQHVFPLSKRTGLPLKTAVKYPYHITVKDREYFFMAGIWQPWTDQSTGEYVESFAIITTAANELMAKVHNTKKRMPTILDEDMAYEWLLGDLEESRITQIARSAFPAGQMQACTIARDFRELADPAEPFAYDELLGSPTL